MSRYNRSGDFTDDERESIIFVSIPSYRDLECPKTIQDLFRKARFPARLLVGVCEQNYQGDYGALTFPGASQVRGNIRLHSMPAADAKGPMFARALIEQELYDKGEADYWLQIDSHMGFTKDFDVNLIRQQAMTPDPRRSIITAYPPDLKDRRAISPLTLPTFLKFHCFDQNRGFIAQQKQTFREFPETTRPSLFYAAGFTFGPAEAHETVRYDPHTDYLFLGEEISMNLRFYTHGYNMFCPCSSLLYHMANRNYRPTFWEQIYRKNTKQPPVVREQRKELEAKALKRLQDLVFEGIDPPEKEYGLGRERTIAEFEDYIGVDMLNKRATPRAGLGISPDAPDIEWREKLGISKDEWQKIYSVSQVKY